MSVLQMLWYSHNINEDERELLEAVRDVAEYMMSFVNPEAVNKIKMSREEGNNMESTDSAESIVDQFTKSSSGIFKDIGEIKSIVGSTQTNNNKELVRDIDFKGQLFDLTKEY